MKFKVSSFDEPWWVYCLLAATIAAYAYYGPVAALRFIGLSSVLGGIRILRTRSIPYGWEGAPPSGFITGKSAVVFGLVSVLIGIGLMLNPVRTSCMLGFDEVPCEKESPE